MRKGQLVSGSLVVIILVVVGLIIGVLFILGVFGNQDLTERETCRLSVLSRATVPGVLQQAIPLNCQTEKICITSKDSIFSGAAIFGKDGSDCAQFAGEKNVREVKVKVGGSIGEDARSIETIQREVANAMYDCWIMSGQGKLDIFRGTSSASVSSQLFDEALELTELSLRDINPTCLVCSRVAFSEKLTKSIEGKRLLKQIDYNSFMSKEKVPGSSLTYFQTFTDEGVGAGYGTVGLSEGLSKYIGKDLNASDVKEIKNILRIQFRNQPEELEKIEDLDAEKLKTYFASMSTPTSSDQIAVIFTQMKVPATDPKDQFWNTFRNGAVIGGITSISSPGKIASYLLPGPGWFKALYKIGFIGSTSLTLALDNEDTASSNQALAAATCGNFESTIEGEQKGCSLVKLMNWNIENINTLCTGGIESNL